MWQIAMSRKKFKEQAEQEKQEKEQQQEAANKPEQPPSEQSGTIEPLDSAREPQVMMQKQTNIRHSIKATKASGTVEEDSQMGAESTPYGSPRVDDKMIIDTERSSLKQPFHLPLIDIPADPLAVLNGILAKADSAIQSFEWKLADLVGEPTPREYKQGQPRDKPVKSRRKKGTQVGGQLTWRAISDKFETQFKYQIVGDIL